MPGMLIPFFFMSSMKSSGARFASSARLKFCAAPSMAPPKRGPMVSRPETSEEMMSLPALAATMAL